MRNAKKNPDMTTMTATIRLTISTPTDGRPNKQEFEQWLRGVVESSFDMPDTLVKVKVDKLVEV